MIFQENFNDAKDVFDQAHNLCQDDCPELKTKICIGIAECLYLQGEYVEGLKYLKTSPDKGKLSQDSKTRFLLVLSGHQIGMGMFSDAKLTLTELHATDHDLTIVLSKASRFIELGMFSEAKKILELQNTKDDEKTISDVDQAYLGAMLGYSLLAMDNEDEGFKLLHENVTILEGLPSIKYGPELVDFHLYLAEAQLKRKNVTNASKHLQTAQKYVVQFFEMYLDHHPKFAKIITLFGLIRLETSDYEKAKINLQEALEMSKKLVKDESHQPVGSFLVWIHQGLAEIAIKKDLDKAKAIDENAKALEIAKIVFPEDSEFLTKQIKDFKKDLEA